MNRLIQLVCLAGLVLFASAAPALADGFSVTLNTSGTNLIGAQALVFELTDGDGVANNSVTLSGFSLGGGSTAGAADYLGSTGVTGDLSGTISMDDSGGLALFSQDVNLGSSLSFVLDTTNNFAGTTPDGFIMALCAVDFSSCYSDDTVDGSLLILPLNGTSLTPGSFTLTGASGQDLPAPMITSGSGMSPVPEPSGLILMSAGLLTIGVLSRRSQALDRQD